MIKVIVFDFDNCIVLDEKTRTGSEEVKDGAWFEVFSEYNRAELDTVVEKVKRDIAGGKGDRKDIAARVLKHFGFPESEIPQEVPRRCQRFDEIIQEGIKRISISDATRESIAELAERFPLYINTATPREAALESLAVLRIAGFFKAVYGRPGTKVGNLREILAAESATPSEMLFIDDQESGRKAGEEIGCTFVGMQTARNKLWNETPQPFPIIKSFKEISHLLET